MKKANNPNEDNDGFATVIVPQLKGPHQTVQEHWAQNQTFEGVRLGDTDDRHSPSMEFLTRYLKIKTLVMRLRLK